MMRTITFDSKIQDGMIKVPEMYNTLYTDNIKVTMIIECSTDTDPDPDPGKKPKAKRVKGITHNSKRARGCLTGFKNSRLIEKEKSAWEIAVKEKYEAS